MQDNIAGRLAEHNCSRSTQVKSLIVMRNRTQM